MLYLESTNLFIVIDVKVFKCSIICSLPICLKSSVPFCSLLIPLWWYWPMFCCWTSPEDTTCTLCVCNNCSLPLDKNPLPPDLYIAEFFIFTFLQRLLFFCQSDSRISCIASTFISINGIYYLTYSCLCIALLI